MDAKDCSGSVDDLTEGQMKTLHDWEEKFRSKYPEVGKVRLSGSFLLSDQQVPGLTALEEIYTHRHLSGATLRRYKCHFSKGDARDRKKLPALLHEHIQA